MRILVFAPHPDDEILGCGGVMAKHIAHGDDVYVCVVTSSRVEKYRAMHQDYARKVGEYIGVEDVYFFDYPTVELSTVNDRDFTGSFNELVQKIQPEIVYIPFYGDMHTDHKKVADAAMVALRPYSAPFVREIYAYETLSETGWNYPTVDKTFIPNVFEDISAYVDVKVHAMEMYETKIEKSPHPRSAEGIRTLAKYRGGTVGVEYAEAFMCLRRINR